MALVIKNETKNYGKNEKSNDTDFFIGYLW